MKIKINESQLKRIVKHLPLNEVGGYDSKDLMGFHGGMVQGEITFLISRFVSKMEQVMDYMHSEEVTKENLQKGLLFINDEIEDNIKRLGELTSEIYFDDDLKTEMKSYIKAVNKMYKYFKILVDVKTGVYGSNVVTGLTGLSNDMTTEDLTLEIKKKLVGLADDLGAIGEKLSQVRERYLKRLSDN